MSDTIEHAQTINYEDAWLLGGARTPFADYNGTLRDVSATDLGIKAAREALAATKASPDNIDAVVTSSVAQTSFDAFFLRAISASMPACRSACRRCWCSGCARRASRRSCRRPTRSRSASRRRCCASEPNPCRATPSPSYSHRGGFRMGQVEFKDFLWEATMDTAPKIRMGDTAEELAKRYQITREDTDAFAAASFDRANKAREAGYFKNEVVPVVAEQFARRGLPDARDQASSWSEGGGSGRASAADAAGSAQGAQGRVQGCADGWQQLGDCRRRGRRRCCERER